MNKLDIMRFWPASEAALWHPLTGREDVLAYKPVGRLDAWGVIALTGMFHSGVVLPERRGADTIITLSGEDGLPYEYLGEAAAHLRALITFLRDLPTNHHRLAWLKDTTDAVTAQDAKTNMLMRFGQFDESENRPADDDTEEQRVDVPFGDKQP